MQQKRTIPLILRNVPTKADCYTNMYMQRGIYPLRPHPRDQRKKTPCVNIKINDYDGTQKEIDAEYRAWTTQKWMNKIASKCRYKLGYNYVPTISIP